MTPIIVATRRTLAILLLSALLAGCVGKAEDSAEDAHAHAEGESHDDEAPADSTRHARTGASRAPCVAHPDCGSH